MKKVELLKKVIIKGKIRAETGLHIGGAREVSEIGGMDNPVIKEPLTGLPYIPGSSLKGKLRSLLEVHRGKGLNRDVGRKGYKIKIHCCDTTEEALSCDVCAVFGSSAEKGKPGSNLPSRAIFRDAYLTEEWRKRFEEEPLLEEKWEAAIDRLTSAANPRSLEVVPPGVEFAFEIVYNVEKVEGIEGKSQLSAAEGLKNLFSAMKLLENDYLGGSGSRGYGKVKFTVESITVRSKGYYKRAEEERRLLTEKKSVEEIIRDFDSIFGGELEGNST